MLSLAMGSTIVATIIREDYMLHVLHWCYVIIDLVSKIASNIDSSQNLLGPLLLTWLNYNPSMDK